jgi:hypothetical protein
MSKQRQPMKSSRQEKVGWLLAHAGQWCGFPYQWVDMEPQHRELATAIAKQMRAEGLFSPKTRLLDIDIFGMIQEARLLRRQRKAGKP